MVDWTDPSMWQVGVKTATALVGLGERLRKLMTRKGGGSKSGGVNTPELPDSLAKVVKNMLDMMQKLNHDTAQTFTGILDVMRPQSPNRGVGEGSQEEAAQGGEADAADLGSSDETADSASPRGRWLFVHLLA